MHAFLFLKHVLVFSCYLICMMNSRTIETKNSNIWNARDVRFVGACAETNSATCDPIRVVEQVGVRMAIDRRRANEGGLVHAAGKTAAVFSPDQSKIDSGGCRKPLLDLEQRRFYRPRNPNPNPIRTLAVQR